MPVKPVYSQWPRDIKENFKEYDVINEPFMLPGLSRNLDWGTGFNLLEPF